jgi:hypothetical protein
MGIKIIVNNMPGLKQILLEAIKSGKLTQNDLEAICHMNDFKISNGERRLRELADAGIIMAIKNKGANVAWIYNQPKELILEAKLNQDQLFNIRQGGYKYQ